MYPPGGFLREQVTILKTSAMKRNAVFSAIAVAFAAIAVANKSTGWTVACAVVALLFVVGVLMASSVRANPERHVRIAPLCKAYNCSIDQLSLQIEQELNANPPTGGTVRVMPSWLYGFEGGDLVLVKLDQVAWAYKHTTTQYRNGVKQGQFHKIVVRPLYAPEIELSLSAKSTEAEQLVRYIAQRTPWAWIGYDEQRKAMWATSEGRHQLIGAALARRDGMRRGA